jgi:hypothetical protein
MPSMHGQYFEDYTWKNRLILILSNNPNSDVLNDQLRILKSDKLGLTERKLKIFRIHPYDIDSLEKQEDVIVSERIYNHFIDKNETFQIILIGLDGGVKLRQNKILSRQELYTLIDSMPMRQAEMTKN